jgi:hypothetical protein
MTHRRRITIVSTMIGAVLLGACTNQTSSMSSAKTSHRQQGLEQGIRPALDVAAQNSDGFDVVVASVSLPESALTTSTASSRIDGYVAVASDVASKPGTILGYTAVGEKTTKNVEIRLSDQLTTGTYFFLLYETTSPPRSVGHAMKRLPAYVSVA